MWRTDSFEKNPDAGKDWRQEERGMPEDAMIEWHHWLNGHEFEQAPRVGDEQGILLAAVYGAIRVGHDWVTELNWGSSYQVDKILKV